MDKRAMTVKEAAQYISMSESYLGQDRMNGFRKNRTPGPNFVRVGRTVRYLKEDLDLWLEQNRIERKMFE